MTPPPVSRAGLARCPSCLRHVAVARDVASTVCPFCGGSFAGLSAGGARAASSALVAALGLGLALTGCGARAEPSTPEPGVPAAREPAPPEALPAADGGPTRGEGAPVAPSSDPDPDTDPDDEADTDGAPPPPPVQGVPLYGVAPVPKPAPPPPPIQEVPVYGVAPMRVPVPVPPVQDKPERDR